MRKSTNQVVNVKLFFGIIVMFFLFSFHLYALRINKVEIVGNEHTKESVILQISSELLADRDWGEGELGTIAQRIEERLRNTTWFYSAYVNVVPSGRGEDYRNVIIEVKEGFLLRFSGGNAYGVFGIDNVWGGGEEFLVYLGYNRQSIVFSLNPFIQYFFVNGSFGNLNDVYYSSSFEEVKIQRVGMNLEFGYRFNWDNRLSIHGGYDWVFSKEYQFLFHDYFVGVKYVIDTRDDIFSAMRGYHIGFQGDILRFYYPVVKVDGRVFIPIYDSLRLALRFLGEGGENLPQEYKMDLYGINGVRSEGDIGRLGNVKVQNSFEARMTVFKTSLFGIFNVCFEVMGFWDIGRCFDSIYEVSFSEYEQALGGGIRIYFLEPVFLPLRFEIGFNREGVWKLFFELSEPF